MTYLSDTVATVHARMRLTGQMAVSEGQQPETRFNIFTFVVHKKGDGWSCVAAHNTDVVPGKETNLIEDGELNAADYRQIKK